MYHSGLCASDWRCECLGERAKGRATEIQGHAVGSIANESWVPLEMSCGAKGGLKVYMVCRKNEEPLVDVQKAIGKHEAKRRRGGGSDDEDDDGGSKRKKGRVGRVKNRRIPKKPKQTGLGAHKGLSLIHI